MGSQATHVRLRLPLDTLLGSQLQSAHCWISVSQCSPPGAPPTPQPCLDCFLFLFLRDMIWFLALEGDVFYFFLGVSPEKQGLAPNTQGMSVAMCPSARVTISTTFSVLTVHWG